MNKTKLPDEYSSDKDPNFTYPEKFKVPEDYDFRLRGETN